MSEISSPATLSEQCFTTANPDVSTVLEVVNGKDFASWSANLSDSENQWLQRQAFTAKTGQSAWLASGDESRVVVGTDGVNNFKTLGSLALSLPPGDYTLVSPLSDLQIMGWALGGYQFNRYKSAKRKPAKLQIPAANDTNKIYNTVDAIALSRNLVNTPAADMAPSNLAAEAQALALQFDATIQISVDDELLDMQCGAIHAVGRAAQDPPCLIDLHWGQQHTPTVTVVGKGVTFDSGGLDLKSANGMRLMKKDMGGAATALGLAYLIMAQNLPINLRVLIPCAENAVSGNAFRPGDVLSTHKGLTVEIDNTDAEGRLLLCDALSVACTEQPEYIFDFATLTGSARSAVGTEIAAMFCNDDTLASGMAAAADQTADPVWRMPLHPGYEHMIDGKVADLVNSAASPYAGSVTAALFLQRFVQDTQWAHFDIMAYNNRKRPGHPVGGEAMGLRAVFAFLENMLAERQP